MEIDPNTRMASRRESTRNASARDLQVIDKLAEKFGGKRQNSVLEKLSGKQTEGFSVTGVITDLTPDSVTLATEAGTLTAELRGRQPNAKIGDTASFNVKYDSDGEPYLESKQISSEAVQKSVVSEALTSAGLKSTSENVKMAVELLESGLPLTKENLLRFNQALKLLGADKTSEALFMLKNDLKIGPRSAETLEMLLSVEDNLPTKLGELEKQIMSINDPALKSRLISIFNGDASIKPGPGANPNASGFQGLNNAPIDKNLNADILLKELVSEPNNAARADRIMLALDELPLGELRKLADGLSSISGFSERTNTPQTQIQQEAIDGRGQVSVNTDNPGQVSAVNNPGKETSINNRGNEKATAVNTFNLTAADVVDKIMAKEELIRQIDKLLNPDLLKLGGTDAADSRSMFSEILKGLINDPDLLAPNVRSYIESKLTDLGLNSKISSYNSPGEITARNGGGLDFIKELLLRADGEPGFKSGQTDKLVKPRFQPRIDGSPSDLEDYLNGLKDSISAVQAELLRGAAPESANIIKTLSDINRGLDFAAQLKDIVYLQLPVTVNNHETNTELFIFKDAQKKKKSGAESATALVALDTANLDRVETYIQKEGSKVTFQFRVKSEPVKNILLNNLTKLSDQLSAHGLAVQAYSFRYLTENFTLLSEPGELEHTTENDDASAQTERRLAFDIRL